MLQITVLNPQGKTIHGALIQDGLPLANRDLLRAISPDTKSRTLPAHPSQTHNRSPFSSLLSKSRGGFIRDDAAFQQAR
jgi:hypothetical protein